MIIASHKWNRAASPGTPTSVSTERTWNVDGTGKLMCCYLKAKKAKLVNFCNLSPPTRPISLALNPLSFLAKPPPSHLPSTLSPPFPSGRNVKRRFFYIPCSKTSPWLCRHSKGSSISTTPVSVPTWSGSTDCWGRGTGCATALRGMPTPSSRSTTSRRIRSTCTGPVR